MAAELVNVNLKFWHESVGAESRLGAMHGTNYENTNPS
jgi:hypothetical protein